MDTLGLTPPMIVVLGLLGLTVFLFVSEIVRIDVAAVLMMVLLGVLSGVPGLETLADPRHLFDGFASNAVISIIAVMIIGAGLDRTGVMSKVASLILKHGGATERRVIPLVSGSVAVISSFMQNVGAAALFLPVVSRIAVRADLSVSRLLMPMGFCAILGGTMTMVGSSPLILLNDLIAGANHALPPDKQMTPFHLFAVTPVGLTLVVVGVVYFVVAGRYLLPRAKDDDISANRNVSAYLNRMYGIDSSVYELFVPEHSPLVGDTLANVNDQFNVNVVATHFKGKTRFEPSPQATVEAPAKLAVMGSLSAVRLLIEQTGLILRHSLETFAEDLSPTHAGVAEMVVPPDSPVIGHTPSELKFRETYGMTLLAVYRGGECLSRIGGEDHERVRIGSLPLQAGDTLVGHTPWRALARVAKDRAFVVVTSDYPHEEFRPEKITPALAFFALAIGLVLFSDLRLSLCLLIGAVGMVVTRVLSMDEAYRAVNWTTVFLLASLIPLGRAVEASGTAQWIAVQVLELLGDVPLWQLQAAVAVLATAFTLVMSNVGATVLLVPLAVNIAIAAGGDPAIFALTVAISTSNSFLIPTHQVNALIMGPGGYRVRDFLRAGGGMTVLFLVASLAALNLYF
ncbi:MAG: SLC13 family permease [Alphaproteobacteria bacterium]|nr:SLC13 family permease [Alphaproteobacteria bacterium]MBF0249907.1 SLC13 family permease [Alphaproteobacteria bacterium]